MNSIKLTSLPMCGFIAQLVEHRSGIAEVTGSNTVEALIFSDFFFLIAQIGKLTEMIILHFQHCLFCKQRSVRGHFRLMGQNNYFTFRVIHVLHHSVLAFTQNTLIQLSYMRQHYELSSELYVMVIGLSGVQFSL